MNIFSNLKLRPKLIASFITITILGVFITLIFNQLSIQRLEEDSIPTLETAGELSRLARTVQAETLEFVASGEEETIEELIESTAELLAVVQRMENLSDDPDETAPFEELARSSQSLVTLTEDIINSHSQTLEALEELEEAEGQAETVFTAVDEVIKAEIARNIESGNLDELAEDAIPSTQLLNQFIAGTQLLQREALEFVTVGEEGAIEEFDAAEVTLEAAQASLAPILEADEPGEAEVLQQIEAVKVAVEEAGRAAINSHLNTLALLEELEEQEKALEANLAAVQQLVDRDVNEGFESLTINTLVGSAIVLIVSILVGFFIANGIVQPVTQLAEATEQMEAGNLAVQAQVKSGDEIGKLAVAFNNMASRLRRTTTELEQRALKLEQQSQVIQTSAEVSRRLSTILDEQELAITVVEQVQRAFDYYHAHIYLLNEQDNSLIMRSGTGEAGKAMLAQGHQIAMGQGLVGQAADTNTAVLVPDVSRDDNWLANPLLPDTKAEMAVPIAIGDQVLGVLDVQHDVVNGLNQDDVDLLQSLTNQIAVALRNSRTFAKAQQIAEKETLINTINQKIDAADTTEEVMQIAVRELGQLLGAEKTAIRLLDKNGRHETITQS